MMSPSHRAAFVLAALTGLTGLTATARADLPAQPKSNPMDPSAPPDLSGAPPSPYVADQPKPPPADDDKAKQPKRGDFDAGGQVRLPSGPDEMGEFATFNWVAFDAKGRYFVLDTVTINGNAPLAIIKPDNVAGGAEPSVFGGMTVTLEAMLPEAPFAPKGFETDIGLTLGGGYMREGAMLLSEKDYPLFIGDFQPGFAGGLITKVQLSSLLDFSLVPTWVYQSGEVESLSAVQIPMALIVKLGDLLKVSADLGIYTGDDYSFGAADGGRLATGAALDVKIGSILVHGGAGVASLLTSDSGAYPSIKDSFYIDLNVKYAK